MNAIVTDDTCNKRVALAIKEVHALREASWDGKRYGKSYSECVKEVVGNDPIGTS